VKPPIKLRMTIYTITISSPYRTIREGVKQ
jgi:hypothetical protein